MTPGSVRDFLRRMDLVLVSNLKFQLSKLDFFKVSSEGACAQDNRVKMLSSSDTATRPSKEIHQGVNENPNFLFKGVD